MCQNFQRDVMKEVSAFAAREQWFKFWWRKKSVGSFHDYLHMLPIQMSHLGKCVLDPKGDPISSHGRLLRRMEGYRLYFSYASLRHGKCIPSCPHSSSHDTECLTSFGDHLYDYVLH